MLLHEIHKILFIRTDRLGDVLMNLPALKLLRRTYPKAWISVLADKNTAPILRDHPDIDEVIAIDAAAVRSDLLKLCSLAIKIKKIRYDLCVVSNPDRSWHFLSFAAGIRHRLGYDRKCGFFLTIKKIKNGNYAVHETVKNISLIESVSDKQWDGEIELSNGDLAKKNIEALLSAASGGNFPIVAIHAGTSNPDKLWPAESFAALCKRIDALKKFKIVVIGGSEEKRTSDDLIRRSGVDILDLTGRTGLSELVAFFAHPRIKLLISVDSGPVHVAWIHKVPTVVLYAKNNKGSDPVRWGALGARHEWIHKNMDEITVDEVWEKVQKVLDA